MVQRMVSDHVYRQLHYLMIHKMGFCLHKIGWCDHAIIKTRWRPASKDLLDPIAGSDGRLHGKGMSASLVVPDIRISI